MPPHNLTPLAKKSSIIFSQSSSLFNSAVQIVFIELTKPFEPKKIPNPMINSVNFRKVYHHDSGLSNENYVQQG
ncbi:hypothetical protein SBF1_1660002 [Candidatus Desulfosporosinus infrequens]|uniref:Uncharacterized protein n=1 Tax=Candidatus Desulfosporosinus infrequens TaxID=2043169 RepID=A0A2U3KAW9_9FIRM|nr:hypothetical protein SBF1_1660002 [Candidatus Desulfosporosinus infrequens]